MRARLGSPLCSCASLCLWSALVGACGFVADDDLQAWMDKVSREARPAPLPAPEPAIRHPVRYEPGAGPDPFDAAKISATLHARDAGGPAPDPDRAREPLESYPLDSLRMVGSLRRSGRSVALVEADKLLYQVGEGHHLGQDQGKVIRIDETAMEIEELVQDAAGGWTRRRVRLSIQEKK